MSLDLEISTWREGERRVDAAPPEDRPALERTVRVIVDELRRRLGGPFTAAELAGLYGQGTSWCLELAYEVAPGAPAAWDARTADAAFARYLREATDFAGGRVLDRD